MSEKQIKVWDLPTRLFHWLLVATIIFQYVSVEILEGTIEWHFIGGYVCLGLILFRIIWGMVGSYYARFSQFIVSPSKAITYLSANNQQHYLGHNPAGAYSIILLLSLLVTQASTGLFLTDDIFSNAPYYGTLPEAWEDTANFIHHNGFNFILAAVALHIAAIIFYKVKHNQNLTKAMITGNKPAPANEKNPVNARTNWILFLVCVAIAVISIYLLVEVFAPAPADDFYGY